MYTVEEFDKAKTKVMKYVLYKKRSEHEVRTKFEQTMDEDMLEDIIEYLKQAKYINDAEYIERAVNDFMALKNLSIKEIKYKLIAKGLNKNDIDDYIYENIDELEEYEKRSAEKIKKKKAGTMGELEVRQYLFKKGYKF